MHLVGSYCKDISRCTVNKILNYQRKIFSSFITWSFSNHILELSVSDRVTQFQESTHLQHLLITFVLVSSVIGRILQVCSKILEFKVQKKKSCLGLSIFSDVRIKFPTIFSCIGELWSYCATHLRTEAWICEGQKWRYENISLYRKNYTCGTFIWSRIDVIPSENCRSWTRSWKTVTQTWRESMKR